MKKVKVVEVQGVSHTLTQTDGKTFRLYARQTVFIEEKLISKEFYAERDKGYILLIPEKSTNEEVKNTNKGGTK